MGLFGGAVEGDEIYVPNSVSETWTSLRGVISSHRGITGPSFNDELRRAKFKTYTTLGQSLSAVVTEEPDGSHVVISTVVSWHSTGNKERAQIRAIASELLSYVVTRLGPAPEVDVTDAASSLADEIARYSLLRARGFISAQEFDEEKRRLLEGYRDTDRSLVPHPKKTLRRPARDLKAERFAR